MTISPWPFLFWGAFFILLTVCGLLHFHGIKGLLVSAAGAEAFVLLSRPWWKRGYQRLKRPESSFRDSTLGNRAERRAQKNQHRKR